MTDNKKYTMDKVVPRLFSVSEHLSQAIDLMGQALADLREIEHEMGNLVTMAGGWRYLGKNEGVNVSPNDLPDDMPGE